MKLTSKKLRELENNVAGDTPKTKTVLFIEDATEREIQKRAGELLQRQRDVAEQFYNVLKENSKAEVYIHALDFTSDEKAIVDESNILYRHRVMELFDNAIAQYAHLNDPINKWIFYSQRNTTKQETSYTSNNYSDTEILETH